MRDGREIRSPVVLPPVAPPLAVWPTTRVARSPPKTV
jgi:hypothetical protein